MADYPNNIPAKLEIIKASENIPFDKVTLLQGDPGDGVINGVKVLNDTQINCF